MCSLWWLFDRERGDLVNTYWLLFCHHLCFSAPSFLFLLFSRVFPQLSFYLLLLERKKNKIEQKTIESICYCFSPSQKSLEEISTPFQIFLSTTHIIFLLVTFASLWPKRVHTHTQNLKGSFSPLWWGSWQKRTAHTIVGKQQGLLLFPFFSLGTHPHDGVTHTQGRPLSLSPLWKGLHRHT